MEERELAILELSNLLEREFLFEATSGAAPHKRVEQLEAASILSEPTEQAVETVIVAWALALGKLVAVHGLDLRVVQLVEAKKQVARAKLLNKLVTLSPREHDTLARRVQMFDALVKRLMVRPDHLDDADVEGDVPPTDAKSLMQVACAAAMTLGSFVHQHDKDGTMVSAVCKIVTQAHAGVIAGRKEAANT